MSQPPPNPYAPPRSESDALAMPGAGQARLYREGELLVIPVRGAVFPHRCVVCNAPAEKRLKRKLYWHPPGIYALLCLGALVYVIGALITRKNAEFDMGICQEHATRRRNGMLIGWSGVALLIVLIALTEHSPILPIVGAVLFLAAVITAVLMVQLVTAKRIDDRQAWLKVGRPFLDSM